MIRATTILGQARGRAVKVVRYTDGVTSETIVSTGRLAFTDQLSVTFEGPGIARGGVSVQSFTDTLKRIQAAMRHMVVHLEGCEKKPGRFPKWVHEQTDLRLIATGPGSFVAELSLVSPVEKVGSRANHGPAALEALLRWEGRESSTLPGVVTNELYAISSTAPPGMTIWMGTADDRRMVRFERSLRPRVPVPQRQDALLQGWLKEVNWKSRTAQLHDYAGDFVRLRFGAELDEKMKELATAYVEAVGRGHFDSKGQWKTVLVDHVTATRSYDEPFDLHAFLNDPHPKVFDPDKVVTASEPFDVHQFIRIIRQGRDVE